MTDPPRLFRDTYLQFTTVAREGRRAVSEMLVQSLWYDQLFRADAMQTSEHQPVAVLSPGWWNRSEGPDFRGAQIRFGDTIRTGDVEVHLDHAAWRQHGHHTDPRYDNVILVVVLDAKPPAALPLTSSGRPVPCLLLANYVDDAIYALPDLVDTGDYAIDPNFSNGFCSLIANQCGPQKVLEFTKLAGENRLLNKARVLRERIERAGIDQALYESFMSACGYSRFKHHFRLLAQQLPFERVAQLARQDAFLVEAALLRLAGLLPEHLPPGTPLVPHFARIRALTDDHLSGLRPLSLAWKRVGVRPNNYPERRLGGAARFIAQISRTGFWNTIAGIWSADLTPIARRRSFEKLFPAPMGFWAEHCTWNGKRLKVPAAALGAGRAHAIIGNVFLPATLAIARQQRDRALEERAFELFVAMPKETDNHTVRVMLPRLFGDRPPKRVDFRLQQGLLQIYQDWCEPNPSCRNCPVIGFLDPEGNTSPDRA